MKHLLIFYFKRSLAINALFFTFFVTAPSYGALICQEVLEETYYSPEEKPHVLIDSKRQLVFKSLEDLSEIESLEFAHWLFQQTDSPLFRANRPLKVITTDRFSEEEIESPLPLPSHFKETLEDDSFVAVFPYIHGFQYMGIYEESYDVSERSVVRQRANTSIEEAKRLLKWVQENRPEYNGEPVTAELSIDEAVKEKHYHTRSKLTLIPGVDQHFIFQAGNFGPMIIIGFGGNNDVHSKDYIYLIDPY